MDNASDVLYGPCDATCLKATVRRLERVRASLAERGLDALVIRHVSDVRWVSAFEGVFDSEQAHTVLITRDTASIHSDSRYDKALAARAQGSEWCIEGMGGHAAFLVRGIEAAGAHRIAIEDDLPLSEWRTWLANLDSLDVDLVETHDLVRTLRATKDPGEIACHRQAQEVTDKAFDHMCGWLRTGITEREAQFELDMFLTRHSQGLAFDSICATGANSANPHHVPDDTPIALSDFLVMDFGARWRDYDADMTRTVVFGKPTHQQGEIYDIVRTANEACEAYLHAGVIGKDVHDLAVRIISDAGYGPYFGHGLGHGVGIDIHELPVANPSWDLPFASGSVITVEPGIYLPGVGGVRLEDFGVVTDDGYDVFTRASHDLVIL